MKGKAYTLKIRGGVEVDSYGKKAGKGALIQEELSATLGVSQDQTLFQPVTFEPGVASREGGHIYEGVCGTLRAKPGDNQMAVAYSFDSLSSNSMKSSNPESGCREVKVAKCPDTTNPDPSKNQGGIAVLQPMLVENHPADSRCRIDESGTCQALTSRMGTGGNNVPMVMMPTVCIEGNGSRPSHRGDGYKESDKMFTLNTVGRRSVCYPKWWDGTQTAGTLTAHNASGQQRMPDKDNFTCVLEPMRGGGAMSLETFHCNSEEEKTPPLKARDYKDPIVIAIDRAAFNQGENAQYDFQVDVGGVAQTIVAKGPGAVCIRRPSERFVQETLKESETSMSKKERW